MISMIPDWETNRVYFSDLLPVRHPKVWQQLKEILARHWKSASKMGR